MTNDFGGLVRENWASVLEDGFEIAEDRSGLVEMSSTKVCVRAVPTPHGEVDVEAYLVSGDRNLNWTYTGMVGRASAGRLLEIALEHMRSDPAILGGDAAFYEQLARQRSAEAHALTEFYAGRGPNPRRRRLP